MPLQPQQQDVTAAIAAARASLKPAVDAGMFSKRPPTRLKKFLLKFSMTSFKDHREPSWDETGFQYDDARAQPVIAKAAEGEAEADAMLREIACAKLPEGLPPNLADYVARVLADWSRPDRRGAPHKFDRDVCIFYAVEDIKQRGFHAMRHEATEHRESASSIVASALKELGVTMPEKSIERIWQGIHRSIPANSVRS
jgi:hypothetical protein